MIFFINLVIYLFGATIWLNVMLFYLDLLLIFFCVSSIHYYFEENDLERKILKNTSQSFLLKFLEDIVLSFFNRMLMSTFPPSVFFVLKIMP